MLEIFPGNALDSSVITTVWVGLSIVCMLNLRFGMTLSGLVIPGYLVPLLILRPASAIITVIEGLITYAIALLLVRGFFVRAGMGEMFGRDRFFAIVLISVLVRVVSDGWALPAFGAWLNSVGWSFDYRNNFHSFGLVIISLIANQMWNGGARRGMTALIIYTGLTYLVVRFGLMNFTNFSISNLGFMYEHMASSILASPQTYIILLTTAFIASRMNLRYGWEFNGILLPALLALQWYQPVKLAATIGEAFLILIVSRGLLKLPWFNQRNMEGARLLLLFFTVGFFYKMIFSYLMAWQLPTVKVSDYYAFGYLLSTLLAVKIFQKDIAIRLTRATLQTSLIAVMIASVIGFALSYVALSDPPRSLAADSPAPVAAGAQRVDKNRSDRLAERILQSKTQLYRYEKGGEAPPDIGALQGFEKGLLALRRYRLHQDGADLAKARAHLAAAGFALEDFAGTALFIRDLDPHRSAGLYVIRVNAGSKLIIEVPAPLDERGTMEAAAWYFENQNAAGLAVAGSRRAGRESGAGDIMESRHTFFHIFHEVFGQGNALQIRGMVQAGRPAVRAQTLQQTTRESVLWVKREFPEGLVPAELESIIGPLNIRWGAPPFANLQRSDSAAGFAELFLPLPALRALLTQSATAPPLAQLEESEPVEGYLPGLLNEGLLNAARKGSESYVPAALNKLLFLNDEVIEPLLALTEREQGGTLSAPATEELRQINALALSFGYQLASYRQPDTQALYLVLRETGDSQARRHWGTYVFRTGPARNWAVQVPRPLSERQTVGFAAHFFARHNARVLMIAGSHEDANIDGSADVLNSDNPNTLFNMVHQALVWRVEGPMLALQVRSAGTVDDMPAGADALLAFREATPKSAVAAQARELDAALAGEGLRVATAGGALVAGEYDVARNAQSVFMDNAMNKDLAVLWLTPATRAVFNAQPDARSDLNKLAALHIPSASVVLAQWAGGQRMATATPDEAGMLIGLLGEFSETRDIMALAQLQATYPKWRWQHLIDVASGQAFLAVSSEDQRLLALANLRPLGGDRVALLPGSFLLDADLATFVNRRAALLYAGDEP